MNKLIDTHAHLYLEEFEKDIDVIIQRSKKCEIDKIILPNIDYSTVNSLLELVEKNKDYCYASIGLHPTHVKENPLEELKKIETLLGIYKFIAIGEIGIDLYWDKTFWKEQEEVFVIQLNWAKQLGLPVIVHTRNSFSQTYEIIKQEQDGRLKGVFHCFSGNTEQAKKVIDQNFLIGVGGVLTFKNSGLDKVAEEIELINIVLETDAPFLAPVPYRGQRNESAYLVQIATKLAEIKNVSIGEIADITTNNAIKLFNL